MGIINSKKPNTLFRIGGGSVPTGTIHINSNGLHTVGGYAKANVNVPQGITPTGTKEITSNGVENIATYEYVDVDVPQGVFPSGTKSITENGTFDVESFKNVDVDVPTGVTPTGTKTITENGTFDVVNFANADVNVPQGVIPTGTIPITVNGTVDVTNYASADVNVPQGVFPSGTKNIVVNGDYDVTNYANAHIAVPNTNILPRMITGAFTYDGTRYITLNNNMKNQHLCVNNCYIYDGDFIADYSYYWDTKKTVTECRGVRSTALGFYYNVFNGMPLNFTTVFPFFNSSHYIQTSTQTHLFYQYRNGNDIVIDTYDDETGQPYTTHGFKVGTTYYYILSCSEIIYDFSHASLTKVRYSYNVGDTLNLNDLRIIDVEMYVDGIKLGKDEQTVRLPLALSAVQSDNVSIDSSQVDMSTAGTYLLYVTVTWNNTSNTFSVEIKVH